MKMIKAIIRPEKEELAVKQLEQIGICALTKWDVLGRGRQRGIQVGGTVYPELPKVCLMLVVEDEEAAPVIEALMTAAYTGQPGDGRVFVSEIESSYVIRTGKPVKVDARPVTVVA